MSKNNLFNNKPHYFADFKCIKRHSTNGLSKCNFYGKLAMYESMKKSVIPVFDNGLVSATSTSKYKSKVM